MKNTDHQKPDDSYCFKRADNEDRWEFIQQYIQADYQTLLDIGCAEGYFTNAAAEHGLQAMGIDDNKERYEFAQAEFGNTDNICFQLHHVTPENISDLPSADITLLLTVQHHWAGAFGIEEATQMLRILAEKTNLLCYEPPGTMYLRKDNPIEPSNSMERYREYIIGLFDGLVTIVDAEMFPHVNEGKYSDRRDPLFVINTADV